jgi:arginyl-tRNA synthetase
MTDYMHYWKQRVADALNELGGEAATLPAAGLPEAVAAETVVAEFPPKPEMGDLGFPMFGYAKRLRKGPPAIAAALAATFNDTRVKAAGPYLNVFLDRAEIAAAALNEGENPLSRPLEGRRVMVEFSSPNTNKPLHLGHLRNDALGESVSRILAACGAEVRKVCIINDRGVHICKSMLAYKLFGGGKTPESAGVKSDHFVGDFYVRFHQESAENPALEEQAREMLRKWEAGDSETVELWKTMNKWTVDGMKETYRRTGISFDQYYFESETWRKGKEEVLKGLENGLFYRDEDGSVWADLRAENLDKKVLLRKDGTSLYITQDFGTAILRHNDWPFDRLVYVVGSEQQYHFRVLFTLLSRLGFNWAKNLYHLSYGMVNLPEGKMKSREGTVVDADDLLDALRGMALDEIRSKEREEAVGSPEETAEKIALGALHYYLLQVAPEREMLFDPKESLSFNGNTGPYLQYMGARISALLRKAALQNITAGDAVQPELLKTDVEWELIKSVGRFDNAVTEAAQNMNPQAITAWLYDLSKNFNRFYHDCPILNAETDSGDRSLTATRLALCRAVLRVIRAAFDLVCIPFLESM